ncbi:MAG: hypothetical protein WBL24_06640, partial [Kiritimatiellia bacterium]
HLEKEGGPVNILFAYNRGLDWYSDAHAAGVEAANLPIEVSLEKFWSASPFDYDVVHIQWPETLFNWRTPSADELELLRRRLKDIRSRAKIIYTRHNEVSHNADTGAQRILRELYALIESECDVMVHLGEPSKTACETRPDLREKQHVMIPIPVYDEIYAPYLEMDRAEVRRRLGIPLHQKVALAFGHFRNEAERQLTVHAFGALNERDALLVAPGWNQPIPKWRPLALLHSACQTLRARRRGMRLGTKRLLPHPAVARYFIAADVVFLQRLDGLNSANVPMAFLFSKVVAGPDCGNIGYWLRKTGNPVFKPSQPSSAGTALKQALDLAASGLGKANYQFAMSNWSMRQIGEAYAALYRKTGSHVV